MALADRSLTHIFSASLISSVYVILFWVITLHYFLAANWKANFPHPFSYTPPPHLFGNVEVIWLSGQDRNTNLGMRGSCCWWWWPCHFLECFQVLFSNPLGWHCLKTWHFQFVRKASSSFESQTFILVDPSVANVCWNESSRSKETPGVACFPTDRDPEPCSHSCDRGYSCLALIIIYNACIPGFEMH